MYKKLRALILVVPVFPVLLISLLILSCGEDDSKTTQSPYPYGNYQQQYPYGNYPTTNYNPSGNYNPYGNYYPTPNTFPTYGQKQICGTAGDAPCPAGYSCQIVSPPPGVFNVRMMGYCEPR